MKSAKPVDLQRQSNLRKDTKYFAISVSAGPFERTTLYDHGSMDEMQPNDFLLRDSHPMPQ